MRTESASKSAPAGDIAPPGRTVPRRDHLLDRLRQQIDAVERRGVAGVAEATRGTGRRATLATLATGWCGPEAEAGQWDQVDEGEANEFARLRRGAVHEWFGVAAGPPPPRSWAEAKGESPAAKSSAGWRGRGRGARRSAEAGWRGGSPPLALAIHLAHQAHAAEPRGAVVWVGRETWPYAPVLAGGDLGGGGVGGGAGGGGSGGGLLGVSVFLDPPDGATKLWAMDAAARWPGVAVVIGEGRGLSMASTRRLQLAAEAAGGMLWLLRPPGERGELSAASTRWWVQSQPSGRGRPRWTLWLLHRKGAAGRGRGDQDENVGREAEHPRIELEWDGHACHVCASAALAHGPLVAASGSSGVGGSVGGLQRLGRAKPTGSGSQSGQSGAAGGRPVFPASA